ncbi:MAG: DUF6382 domain-containing protein [Eubacterium ramulus]
MKTSYQRELKRNYLIVETETSEGQGEPPFEQKMLEQNQIDGILRFQVRQKDEEVRFFYEITSKQPLSRLLEGQTIQAEQIRALVFGIARSLDHMEQYLLSEKSVLLDPEYLYVDPESLKVWLCLVPGMECDFPEDYSRFLEYLLGKVDHRDKESVVLAYGLYQETRKENYGMADILRLAQQKSSVSGPNHKSGTKSQWQRSDDLEVLQSAGGNIAGEKSLEEGDHVQRSRQENGWQLGTVRGKQIQTDAQEESAGLLGRWKQRRKERKEEKQRELERAVQMPWDTIAFDGASPEEWGTPEGYGRAEYKEERGTENSGVRYEMGNGGTAYDPGSRAGRQQPLEAAAAAQSSDTILLNGETNGAAAQVKRLTALEPGTEDIVIAYYPFIIGKQENLVDYVLRRETVSRLHLRIDRKEDRYYVQDLNSTNGTMAGGHILENNEIMEIWDGVEISIAGARYRFE